MFKDGYWEYQVNAKRKKQTIAYLAFKNGYSVEEWE